MQRTCSKPREIGDALIRLVCCELRDAVLFNDLQWLRVCLLGNLTWEAVGLTTVRACCCCCVVQGLGMERMINHQLVDAERLRVEG
jgi:hypothetical protein